MTSQGSPYSRFRRALDGGNMLIIRAAAAELPRIGVEHAGDARRAGVKVGRLDHRVRQHTREKNQIHAALQCNLVERQPMSDLFGVKGRAWLAERVERLPLDER